MIDQTDEVVARPTPLGEPEVRQQQKRTVQLGGVVAHVAPHPSLAVHPAILVGDIGVELIDDVRHGHPPAR
jgi:hypothetical protein